MLTKAQIELNMKKKFGGYLTLHGIEEKHIIEFVSDQVLLSLKPECKRCFDKGYSSTMMDYKTPGEIIGIKEDNKPIRSRILYCDCSQGKNLKTLIEDNYSPNYK